MTVSLDAWLPIVGCGIDYDRVCSCSSPPVRWSWCANACRDGGHDVLGVPAWSICGWSFAICLLQPVAATCAHGSREGPPVLVDVRYFEDYGLKDSRSASSVLDDSNSVAGCQRLEGQTCEPVNVYWFASMDTPALLRRRNWFG